jgi:hypothetical protein
MFCGVGADQERESAFSKNRKTVTVVTCHQRFCCSITKIKEHHHGQGVFERVRLEPEQ